MKGGIGEGLPAKRITAVGSERDDWPTWPDAATTPRSEDAGLESSGRCGRPTTTPTTSLNDSATVASTAMMRGLAMPNLETGSLCFSGGHSTTAVPSIMTALTRVMESWKAFRFGTLFPI